MDLKIVLGVLAIVVAAVAVFRRVRGRSAASPEELRAHAEAVAGMRDMWLTTGPSVDSAGRPLAAGAPIAVIWDWGIETDHVTCTANADGEASIFFSFGGGRLGAGTHPEVAAAAKAAVRVAAEEYAAMEVAVDHRLPPPGMSAIYVRTPEALRCVRGFRDDGPAPGTVGAKLYAAMQDLLTVMRRNGVIVG
jgi:hypothetical protein